MEGCKTSAGEKTDAGATEAKVTEAASTLGMGQCLSCLLVLWGALGGFSLGCSPSGTVKSTGGPDSAYDPGEASSSEAALVSEAVPASPDAPAADTMAPDMIVGEAMSPSPLAEPPVDQGMIIRPDTTVTPEILEVPAPDGVDPEMVFPPRRPSGRMGGPAQPFSKSLPEADTIGTDGLKQK
jgi:hypothetical protein